MKKAILFDLDGTLVDTVEDIRCAINHCMNLTYNREITRELVDSMTEEIYLNVEPEERQSTISTARPILKNGDVRNPNAKEPEVRNETRQRNFLLRDLIRILILRELLRRRQRPPMPPMRPPRPPMPPMRPY